MCMSSIASSCQLESDEIFVKAATCVNIKRDLTRCLGMGVRKRNILLDSRVNFGSYSVFNCVLQEMTMSLVRASLGILSVALGFAFTAPAGAVTPAEPPVTISGTGGQSAFGSFTISSAGLYELVLDATVSSVGWFVGANIENAASQTIAGSSIFVAGGVNPSFVSTSGFFALLPGSYKETIGSYTFDNGNVTATATLVSAPGPIAGAGFPALLCMMGSIVWLRRRTV